MGQDNDKTYVVCHMMASVDGRIDCDMTERIGGDEYYEALDALGCDSTLSGRVTMQMHYALPGTFSHGGTSPLGRPGWHMARRAQGYEIALDSGGRLLWPEDADCGGKPLLVAASEQAPKEYFAMLERQGISWIAAGDDKVDLAAMLRVLHDVFGVRRLAVVGGGNINGAFLEAGLLDEVSVVFGAGIDGRKGMTAVFDGIDDPAFPTVLLSLKDVRRIGASSVWLRYDVPRG